MKIRRIFAMILRYVYYLKHSYDRLSDVFYWPVIDMLIFGLTSLSFKQYLPGQSNAIFSVIAGVFLWVMIWRGQYEITVNLLEELWRDNLINIFASPLSFSEWTLSVLFVGIIKASISFLFVTTIGYLVWGFNIFSIGLYLLPVCLSLIMSGWVIGFLVAGLVFRFGTKIQTLAWSAAVIISPFSAVYYPLSTLPHWAQNISRLLPTSYVFESARQLINGGIFNYQNITISFLLNFLYLILAFVYLKTGFNKALDRGLNKVY